MESKENRKNWENIKISENIWLSCQKNDDNCHKNGRQRDFDYKNEGKSENNEKSQIWFIKWEKKIQKEEINLICQCQPGKSSRFIFNFSSSTEDVFLTMCRIVVIVIGAE